MTTMLKPQTADRVDRRRPRNQTAAAAARRSYARGSSCVPSSSGARGFAVPDVLVDVCTECDHMISVPQQSVEQLREAVERSNGRSEEGARRISNC